MRGPKAFSAPKKASFSRRKEESKGNFRAISKEKSKRTLSSENKNCSSSLSEIFQPLLSNLYSKQAQAKGEPISTKSFRKNWFSTQKKFSGSSAFQHSNAPKEVFPQIIKPGIVIESAACGPLQTQKGFPVDGQETRKNSAVHPRINLNLQRKINDQGEKLSSKTHRGISPSPKKHKLEVLSPDSNCIESEDEIHDVWDNTDLEIRGIDAEKDLQLDGKSFNFFHWYKARYGSYPNKRTHISNRKVADAIIKLSSGTRKVKHAKFIRPDFLDTNDYSIPQFLNENMINFIDYWKSQRRKTYNKNHGNMRIIASRSPNYPNINEATHKENDLYEDKNKITIIPLINQIKTSPVKNLQEAFRIKPFMMPLRDFSCKAMSARQSPTSNQKNLKPKPEYLEVVEHIQNNPSKKNLEGSLSLSKGRFLKEFHLKSEISKKSQVWREGVNLMKKLYI